MRNLFATMVLWIIRPALELHHKQTHLQRLKDVDDAVLQNVISSRSATATGMESVYGLTRKAR